MIGPPLTRPHRQLLLLDRPLLSLQLFFQPNNNISNNILIINNIILHIDVCIGVDITNNIINATAINAAHPWAVDVSSGVEHARGTKDLGLVHAFIAAVRSCDAAAVRHNAPHPADFTTLA